MKYKQPFTYDAGTTLNEYFNVGNANPPPSLYPNINYLAIGNKGHTVSNGSLFPTSLLHSPTDSALKNQIPYVVRPLNNDLTLEEMSRFRLRVPNIGPNNLYVGYYLMVLDFSPVPIGFTTYTLSNGVVTNQSSYIPTISTQNPTLVDVSNIDVNITSGNKIATQFTPTIYLTPNDVNEIVNACNILFGDPNTAFISEVAIVSGFDIPLPITLNGVTSNYTDIACAQICNFISKMWALTTGIDDGIELQLNYGMSQSIIPTS